MSIKDRAAAAPAAQEKSDFENILDQVSERIGDPKVIENATKAGVLAAAGELLRRKPRSLLGTLKGNWHQEGWQGKAVVVAAGTGAVAVTALGAEIVARKVFDRERGPISWLLETIF